jgi:hypothetical protein
MTKVCHALGNMVKSPRKDRNVLEKWAAPTFLAVRGFFISHDGKSVHFTGQRRQIGEAWSAI